MPLDRVHGDEQLLRDPFVRQPLRRELDHAALGRRQLALRLGPPGADPPELGARLLGPARRAELVERAARLLERPSSGAPLPEPALRPA